MKSQKPHAKAATSKLLPDWIPTQAFLHKQDLSCSPLCPHCELHQETCEHDYV